jgi:hypothetical protein
MEGLGPAATQHTSNLRVDGRSMRKWGWSGGEREEAGERNGYIRLPEKPRHHREKREEGMEPWKATNDQRVTGPDDKRGKLKAHDTMLLT